MSFNRVATNTGAGWFGGLQMLVRVIQGDVVQLYIDTERVYVNQFISGFKLAEAKKFHPPAHLGIGITRHTGFGSRIRDSS